MLQFGCLITKIVFLSAAFGAKSTYERPKGGASMNFTSHIEYMLQTVVFSSYPYVVCEILGRFLANTSKCIYILHRL